MRKKVGHYKHHWQRNRRTPQLRADERRTLSADEVEAALRAADSFRMARRIAFGTLGTRYELVPDSAPGAKALEEAAQPCCSVETKRQPAVSLVYSLARVPGLSS